MVPASGQFNVIGVVTDDNFVPVKDVSVSVFLSWIDLDGNNIQRKVDTTTDAQGKFLAIYTIVIGSDVYSCFANAFLAATRKKGSGNANTPGTNWADGFILNMGTIIIK